MFILLIGCLFFFVGIFSLLRLMIILIYLQFKPKKNALEYSKEYLEHCKKIDNLFK